MAAKWGGITWLEDKIEKKAMKEATKLSELEEDYHIYNHKDEKKMKVKGAKNQAKDLNSRNAEKINATARANARNEKQQDKQQG